MIGAVFQPWEDHRSPAPLLMHTHQFLCCFQGVNLTLKANKASPYPLCTLTLGSYQDKHFALLTHPEHKSPPPFVSGTVAGSSPLGKWLQSSHGSQWEYSVHSSGKSHGTQCKKILSNRRPVKVLIPNELHDTRCFMLYTASQLTEE